MSAASADGVAPSTPTAALRLCLQQRGTQTGLPDGSSRLPATITTNSPEAHHLQRVADKVCLGTLKLYVWSPRLFAASLMLDFRTQWTVHVSECGNHIAELSHRNGETMQR